MRVPVDLEKLKECLDYIAFVNKYTPEEIEVFYRGEFQCIPNEVRSEWMYVGLSTTDFLKDYFSKESKKHE